MKFEVGQIIQHLCKFPDEPEEELDRHLILSVNDKWLKIHCLFTYYDVAAHGAHRVGENGQILISSMDSEEDTPNNFYWRIISWHFLDNFFIDLTISNVYNMCTKHGELNDKLKQ